MNFELAREIYGLTPFCVDSQTLPAMVSILDDLRNGVVYINASIEAKKNSNFSLTRFNSEKKLISREYELNTTENFEGVGVIKIDGPILLNSGASTMGMKEVSQKMIRMNNDSRVKGFVMLIDSGGGSTSAVELMIDTVNEIKSTGKKVYALIDVGGTLASAAYGIASAADEIYYQSDMSIVGSLGTMIQAQGRAANSETDGVKYIRLYATKSVNKNLEIEEALNNDNYEIIINELLNPINERFISLLKENRSQLTDDQLDGSIAFAKDAEGIYVDGKSNLEDLTDKILQGNIQIPQMNTGVNSKNITEKNAKNSEKGNTNTNINTTIMTRSELQSQHPELFQEVYNAGVTAESERAQSWLAHIETDSESVIKGIESG